MTTKDVSKTQLSAAKRALLEKRLKGRDAAPPADGERIERRAVRDSSAPLSFAQQRLWFLSRLDPASFAYNIPSAFRLRGRLDRRALERSLNEIIRRHEILRTSFHQIDAEPRQTVEPEISLRLTVRDLRELTTAEQETEAERVATQEARRPFDLERAPLLRVVLLRLADDEHVFVLTLHHIIFDGWSIGIFLRELGHFYEAYATGAGGATLPELSIQYADFAVWQREWLQGEVLERQLDYWRKQLGGAPLVLELPTDYPRPLAPGQRGAHIQAAFSPALAEKLYELSRREGVTLFMTLLAAFQVLLARYTGQEEITVGTPIANRTRSEIEGLIGFFVNTLALKTDLSGDPTFRALLDRVAEVTTGAYAHQDVPFEKLVEELGHGRDASRNPLFQVMFALLNAPSGDLDLQGLVLSPQRFEIGSTRFELEYHLWEYEGSLRGILVYNTDLFTEATMRRLLGHYETLLEAIVADPSARISSLPLLTRAEERRLLEDWNDTAQQFPHAHAVHQIFERTAARTPDASAILFDGERLTYGELNRRANQLAHHLLKLGVEPDTVVGVAFERSVEMLVAVLGVLKAGGAYLPLDPEYPQERLAFMLEDSGARLLLTRAALLERLPRGSAVPVCLEELDEREEAGASENPQSINASENPPCRTTGDNLTYVVYTSGSTGRPKGIAMPHRPLVNLIRLQTERSSDLSDAPRTLQFASLSFDVSFQEIFSTLGAGGELVLVREEVRRDASALLRLLRDERIERLFLPFVALQQLAEVAVEEQIWPESLREIVTAGEQLKITRPVRELFERLPGCALDNEYGPSETHAATAYRLEGAARLWPDLPPIGRTLPNVRIYLLDARQRPVPIGVTGELYVGGVAMSRGYFNRPDATAERYVPDAFSGDAGARLYSTGDLARYRADGQVEFLGRNDDQVKIRGYRIELSEVELVLRQHARVREAVVLALETATGQKRLVAYLSATSEADASSEETHKVADDSQQVWAQELRRFLQERVPEYMLPSVFVVLEEFPLTPNGKIDRRALPVPDLSRPELQTPYVAPRTETEVLLAEVWSSLLGAERVGVHDNFFELGGHSLLATQLASRVRKTFGVELPLRQIFERPTVERLAQSIETSLSEQATQDEALSSSQHMPVSPPSSVEEPPAAREQALPASAPLTPDERQAQLFDFNQTRREYPRDLCVHQLFEARAAQTPDAVAVEFDAARLSYGELNARANLFAHQLRAAGVEPDEPVAVLMERSAQMVVCWLAILKAGGAYLPLDPEYPQERLAFMLRDSGARLLLSEAVRPDTAHAADAAVSPASDALASLVAQTGVQLVRVESERLVGVAADARPDAGSAGNPTCVTSAENLAYVIYTSGSTGKPKGACIPHRAVNRLVCNTDYVSFAGRDERVAQISNASFDAATFEVWGALLNGARLVGIRRDVALSPEELAAQLLEQKVTHMFLTTSLFNQTARSVPQAFRALRYLLVGGEAADARRFREVLEHGAPAHLLNAYGPTENTTFSLWHEATRIDEDASTLPIGHAIANTRAYVLDERLEPVGVGAAGELYLGGDGLARGYLNQPELTADKFVPDPYSGDAGARLYRTGDVARRISDGQIEYLGRIDSQVKIRGFRIEPGEVEAALKGHARVRECIVVAHGDDAEQKRLVAYLLTTPEDGATNGEPRGLETDELRHYLQQRIPEHMIPSAFVVLERFPLTPNGKVDRRALPSPDTTRPEMHAAYVAPRTATEEMLAGMWAKVLRVERVGVEDDFFDLGGHSLLATQLVSRLRVVFGVELPLRQLFEHPTIEKLARSIERRLHAREGADAPPPLLPATRDRMDAPLSFAQQRLWFLDRLFPQSNAYNLPIMLRLEGALDTGALERSLNEIIRRHEILRTSFRQIDTEPRQIVAPEISLPLPVRDLRAVTAEEREREAERVATEEAGQPFDLERAPLLRAVLLRLADDDHIFLLTFHHIVTDGWSFGVLVREVMALYEAYARGAESPLEELAVQYADFAVWQQRWLRGEALERQLAYWRKQLEGAPAALELPTDRLRPATQTYNGATEIFRLTPALSRRLSALSQREGATLFMTLLAAFQLLLARYTGQEDIVVGSPIANRQYGEIENLIGFFVNTLVLRADLSGARSFRELLARVRETTLEAYAHQDVPFEKLVEELHVERSLSRSPLFQVMFVLQNTPLESLELPGLRVSMLAVENSTEMFDLTLNMGEAEDGLYASLGYNTDLFERATIARMWSHFERLLEEIVEAPERRLEELQMLSGEERTRLLHDWNDTRFDCPAGSLLQGMFEAQAARTPDRIALSFEGDTLTYGELNRRANKLAHHLRGLGVEPDTIVGVALERSLELPVALLGVLKAGGAYLPLDPEYPQERLAFMLEDSGAPLLLTETSLLDKFGETRARAICLDGGGGEGGEAFARESAANPHATATPENLAYVIYTSGSTGRPKGVGVPHRAICNRLHWGARTLPLDERDRVLQLTTISFDVSVWELFAPLVEGATLVLARPGGQQDIPYLSALMREQKVTILNVVPSLLQVLLEDAEFARCDALRQVFVGGEALPAQLPANFYRRLDADLYNLYGPTETTIDATWWKCPRETADGARISIGRPVGNFQAYVLDAHLQPVPAGVAGELYIGGAGVARGYLNRPALTAEKFIPDAFSNEPGARLYRTGDLVRFRPEGEIEFLRRVDEQVKVRGFRIETGEIEAALAHHPGVKKAVVLLSEPKPTRALDVLTPAEAAALMSSLSISPEQFASLDESQLLRLLDEIERLPET